jgi:hypothetical protein
LEHLHLYCQSTYLRRVQDHYHQEIEDAIYNIYNFAARKECNCSFDNLTRNTTLQENMINAAKEAELSNK